MNENAPGSRDKTNWRIRSWGAFTTRKERAEPFSRIENAPLRPRAPAPGTTPLPLLARGRTPPEKDAGAPPPVASAPAALGETAGEQRGETDSDENDCADAESVDGTESSDVDGARDGRSSELSSACAESARPLLPAESAAARGDHSSDDDSAAGGGGGGRAKAPSDDDDGPAAALVAAAAAAAAAASRAAAASASRRSA